ncbi:MAG: hypothetical protein QOJ69_856, partial [Actinomycetota bacterium]|nr:hypothetical protein [Actinomycetota bacterium]
MQPAPVTRRPAWTRRWALAVAVALSLVLSGCSSGSSGSSGSGADPPPADSPASVTTAPPKAAADPGIEDLMVSTGMTPRARRSFTKSDPQIEDASTLAVTCADVIDSAPGSSRSHTYGCVVDGNIHVRAFDRPEVRDLIYVSAAHELLHVVYAQLPRAERDSLDAELNAARAGSAVLEERLKVYKDAGEDTPDEIHSLLGTEFPGLSPALEAHYAKYFDRALVLDAFRRSLGDREDEIRALQARVDEL